MYSTISRFDENAASLREAKVQGKHLAMMASRHASPESKPRATPPAKARGLIVFDHKGRLVKADSHAELLLSAIGVEVNGSPRLRIDALDASEAKTTDDDDLPDWLDPDWIEAVIEDGERLGTVVQIPERASATTLQQSGLPQYKLRRVIDFIRAHIDEAIHLEQLAAAVSLSPFHFHREFKRSTGVTPHQYIVQVRMERAKGLLSGSDMPLAQVAAQVGFADQSHFCATFRRTTSMTPRTYRNATCTA